MTSFTVALPDVRAGLTSVVPHVEPDPELPALHRVRLEVGSVNVTVTASNGFTAALAIVSVEDNHDGELARFDLSPTDVKKILGLFKQHKDGAGQMLRFDVTDLHVKVTDISGLFDGESLTLLRIADGDSFPDIAAVIARSISQVGAPTDRLVTNGSLVKLFTVAASAYGRPLVIEPTGTRSGLLISCGESFLGLLMPIRLDEDKEAQMRSWRRNWLERLPAADTVPAGASS